MKRRPRLTLIFLAVLGVGFAATALAAGGGPKADKQHWGFNGLFGTYDRAATRRGYQVYREVCASCHALEHLSFRHLGEDAGPFVSKEYPNPNDNPWVKALAADWTVTDGPDDVGDMFERPGRPSDKFPPPFPNAEAAKAANGGSAPADLSLIVKARAGGADYIYSLLTSYNEPPTDMDMNPGLHYNPMFQGEQIAMAPPLGADGMVEYEDGTEATQAQMARDVTEFLAWAADHP